jgi:diguanylate cyclase (GGDEF)-like protein/PAS domain S-box-containing protein
MAIWKQRFIDGESYEAQYRLKHANGEHRWVLSRGQVEKDASGTRLRWYGTCTDIHEQVTAREALQANEAVTRSMVEASPDCVALLDPEGSVQFLNQAAIHALPGADRGAWLGRSWSEAFSPSVRRSAVRALAQAQAGRSGRFTASEATVGGARWWDVVVTPITNEVGACSGLLSIARDITHQKTAEERVRWAANHDSLTQLPNRTLFQRMLDRALIDAEQNGGAVTVLMMDLDDFKRTNDALGHDAGDALLTEFGARVRAAVRADDVVARFGGDEFGVLLQGVNRKEEVEAAVSSILSALKAPCHFEGKLLDIRTSIGASSFPGDGSCRSELLKHADIALYVAKGAGRGVLRIFEPSMRAEAQNRMSMLSLAKDALTNDRIRPFYQPKLDLRTGHVDGFEALLRWDHPVKGVQTPDTITAAFHDMTLAAEISDVMIDAVISDIRRWTDEGVVFGHVAVNAAAAEFRREGFAERLLERLDRANLPTAAVQVEVTETVFLGRGAEYVENSLKLLAAEGLLIALDDFGTGYASLSHLNHFPVNTIKIDRSFISRLETSDHDAAIVRAVINLGRSLGIKIVAEGVETHRQAEFLKKHRCHSAQGYLYSKAVEEASVPLIVETYNNRRSLSTES